MTLNVEEFIQALDPVPELERQHPNEVHWQPDLVYDDRGWPPAVVTFYD